MIGQLLLNLGASLAGGIVGVWENMSANELDRLRIKEEIERDKELARQKQLASFYESMSRADDPLKIVKEGINIWGKKFKKTYYKFAPIPARQHRYYVVLILAVAYAFVMGYCAIDADRAIASFPATPDHSKLFGFFGLTLVETTKTKVWELTLGGLILPLLSPISFALTKYITGADYRKQ